MIRRMHIGTMKHHYILIRCLQLERLNRGGRPIKEHVSGGPGFDPQSNKYSQSKINSKTTCSIGSGVEQPAISLFGILSSRQDMAASMLTSEQL